LGGSKDKEEMRYLFTISRVELKRVLMHIPVGLVTLVIGFFAWWVGAIFALGFVFYELNEDWHLSDGAWQDIKGFLWGLGIGGVAIFLLELMGVM